MVSDHQSTVAAAGTSAVATLGVAATSPPPDSLMTLLPYLGTILGPAVVLLFNRLLSARAAGKRARAGRVEARAKVELAEAEAAKADADPANDAAADLARDEALKALDDAAAQHAEADALEALRPRSGH